jgi:uncharacterized iron-regulated protein
MKKITLLLVVCSIFHFAKAQSFEAYSIYTKDGKPATFEAMAKDVLKSNVILFGELHDNPISHWLQLELTIFAHNKLKDKLTLGAEMFETDNQLIIDEYLTGFITQGRFEAEARLWRNYKTDYKPLLEFAKSNNLQFIATNIPRRYASMVSTDGLESLEKLPVESRNLIAPLPIEYDPELPGYKAMLNMNSMPGKGMNAENFPKAQAIKDATMAWNITDNLQKGQIFIHFHGTYHSNNYEGIYWYLLRYTPKIKIATIATVLQDSTTSLETENIGLADFIIVVPTRMTRTY